MSEQEFDFQSTKSLERESTDTPDSAAPRAPWRSPNNTTRIRKGKFGTNAEQVPSDEDVQESGEFIQELQPSDAVRSILSFSPTSSRQRRNAHDSPAPTKERGAIHVEESGTADSEASRQERLQLFADESNLDPSLSENIDQIQWQSVLDITPYSGDERMTSRNDDGSNDEEVPNLVANDPLLKSLKVKESSELPIETEKQQSIPEPTRSWDMSTSTNEDVGGVLSQEEGWADVSENDEPKEVDATALLLPAPENVESSPSLSKKGNHRRKHSFRIALSRRKSSSESFSGHHRRSNSATKEKSYSASNNKEKKRNSVLKSRLKRATSSDGVEKKRESSKKRERRRARNRKMNTSRSMNDDGPDASEHVLPAMAEPESVTVEELAPRELHDDTTKQIQFLDSEGDGPMSNNQSDESPDHEALLKMAVLGPDDESDESIPGIEYEDDEEEEGEDDGAVPLFLPGSLMEHSGPVVRQMDVRNSDASNDLLSDFASSPVEPPAHVLIDRDPLAEALAVTAFVPEESYVHGDDGLQSIFNFAMEHRIYLKSLLDLLSQRDSHIVDVDMDDPHTLKAGPLKKASHLVRGIWKVKYVEIRKGMFSYFDDAVSKDGANEGELMRKNIPLNANSCSCRAVKVNHNTLKLAPNGAVFELTVEGGPRRFWVTTSREERQAWIRAIHDATVGKSAVTRGDGASEHNGRKAGSVSTKSPYKMDLEQYLKIQKELRSATTKDAYVGGLFKMVGSPLNVPVQWLTEQSSMWEDKDNVFHEQEISCGVDQLWKDLLRDSVEVNGELFQGGDGHAPERIIGALMTAIVAFDRSVTKDTVDDSGKPNTSNMSAMQSLSYARDILLSGNRTRSGGDSYYCIDALCRNADLIVTVPGSTEAEPLQVTVSPILIDSTSQRNIVTYSLSDRSGWLKTRTKAHKPWKRRFFVLSEGTLSYYEKAQPRPHGLRKQLKLSEVTLTASRVKESGLNTKKKDDELTDEETEAGPLDGHFVISIAGRDGLDLLDREILFEDKNKFLAWTHSLEEAMSKYNTLTRAMTPPPPPVSGPSTPPSTKNKRFRLRSSRDDGVQLTCRDSLCDQAELLGLSSEDVTRRMSALSSMIAVTRGQPTVKVTIRAATLYNICTLDPQGDDAEDTWATIRATFTQSFKISGGSNGKMIRGEELVQVDVVECIEAKDQAGASPLNLGSVAGTIGRTLLRRYGSTDGVDSMPPSSKKD